MEVVANQSSIADVQAWVFVVEPRRRDGHAAVVSGYRIPQYDLEALQVVDENEAVAASEELSAGRRLQGEARGVDAVGRVQCRGEVDDAFAAPAGEEAEERGVWPEAVECAEAADELGIGDEAAPALAYEGGAGEGGRPRREADEDLPEEVVVVRQGRRRREAAAAHQTLLTHLK